MGRRRPKGTPPPKPFDIAWVGIDRLEAAVVSKMVDVTWTHEQMVRWLFDDRTVDILQAAHPYTRPIDRGAHIQEKLLLPLSSAPAVNVYFTIAANAHGILVPTDGLARNETDRFPPIRDTLAQVHNEHLKFEKVRQVVRWLNEHATIGAARHYCPWLTSILPEGHEFQSATGQIYREPAAPMAEIMHVMRECGAIMASALLVGDVDTAPKRHSVNVSFQGIRETGAYASQQFGLL